MRYPNLILVVVLFLSACNQKPESSESLQGRLAAAVAISTPGSRNELLSQLAMDAAHAKDIQVTTNAIESIQNPNLRDSSAQACAEVLSRKGESKGATEVARLIRNPNLREKTVVAIAQGQ
ncbi:MAG: hypothetical protein JNN07_29000 [Verrucomicrobiales bacterium]|nr:hypothetical protein [Verrucomicrobiales bacterium]